MSEYFVKLFLLFLLSLSNLVNVNANISSKNTFHEPTVMIAILVRNKEHTLPYFLTYLENLDYPKDRISLWIKSDHNEDASPEILRHWYKRIDGEEKYHSIALEIIDSPPYLQSDQELPVQWSQKRYRHLISLKTEALRVAKKIWADYIWFLDADVFLLNNQTLKHLVSKNKDLVAPMLKTGGLYSNFWGGMKDYYYQRTEEYGEILDIKKRGCFQVPMIHSAVLMNLKRKNGANFLRTNVSVPEDDVIILAINAKEKDIPMEICNDLNYGYLLSPLNEDSELSLDKEQLLNIRVEIAAFWEPMRASSEFSRWLPKEEEKSTLIFDKIYLVNLKRRPDRLEKMRNVLNILGLDYEIIEASDGRNLTQEKLDEMEIQMLNGYKDPYSARTMTFGEIGCFLSHYRIWFDIVKYHVNVALVLEDDIRFEGYFKFQLLRLFSEAASLKLNWDLMYLGRKRSANAREPWVDNSKYIVHVDYSYWTLGYVITNSGAKKLTEAEPLKKLVPVDEFLPVMYNKHSNFEWKTAYPNRNLKAFSSEPLLLYPTHYTGEEGYISDTEHSHPILLENCTTTVTTASIMKDEL